jgi:hypothetical protein
MHTRDVLIKSIAASIFYNVALIFSLYVLLEQADSNRSGKATVVILLSVISILSIIFIIAGLKKRRIYVLARFPRIYGYEYRASSFVVFYTSIAYRLLVVILAVVGLFMMYN